MAKALSGLDFGDFPEVLVGLNPPDDAGIVQIGEHQALVQSLDFFTPIVDDPFEYGRIASANSMSDIYAKGGRPISAMSVVCFPAKTMPIDVMRELMRGALAALHEAGVPLVGGHSVVDAEMKFGLSVTGLIDPKKIWGKRGIQAGDALLLTKPLGSGIVATGVKKELASDAVGQAMTTTMAALNKYAAEALDGLPIHACTDITGFGLAGHGCEMVADSGCDLVLRAEDLPVLPGTLELAEQGAMPGGLSRNREFYGEKVTIGDAVSAERAALIFDPQTSGGLFVSLPRDAAEEAVRRLAETPTPAAIVGEVVAGSEGIRLV